MLHEGIGGARLYYNDLGSGPVLVFLHGNAQNSDAFSAQTAYFIKHYRLILIDSRGHGKSSHGNIPIDLDLMAKDVLDIVEQLGIKTFSVIGFSDGANLGLKIAIKAKAAVNKMILISPNISPSALRWLPRLAYSVAYIGLKPLDFNRRIQKRRELISLITRDQAFSHEAIGLVHCPCLLIGSEWDMIHRRHFKHLKWMLPSAKLVWLTGIGHMRLKTRAAEINLAIECFLQQESL